MFRKKYQNMNEQITPSRELVNKIMNLDNPPQKINTTQKIKSNWFKPVLKIALPALMIAAIFGSQIINTNLPQVINDSENAAVAEQKSGNWFSLMAYAAEADNENGDEDATPVEITRDMQMKLPGYMFHWGAMSYSEWMEKYPGSDVENLKEGMSDEYFESIKDDMYITTIIFPKEADETGNITRVKRNSFVFDGENMKSVRLETNYGEFTDFDNGYKTSSVLTLEGEEISSKQFSWFPRTLQINLHTLPVKNTENDDYKQYLTDTITVTVTFEDGEVIMQIVELTIDENTGQTFAQIVG